MNNPQNLKTNIKVVKIDSKKNVSSPGIKKTKGQDYESLKSIIGSMTNHSEERKKTSAQNTKANCQQDDSYESKHVVNAMESLINMSQFEGPVKKKIIQKPLKTKEIKIDMENDTQEEIIKKLVLSVHILKEELNEYKNYIDGTFCTLVVHNRSSDELDKRLIELQTQVDVLMH